MATEINNRKNLIESLGNLLIVLNKKEKFIIDERFGLDKKDPATLETVGQSLRITRERVRQIQSNAINKLQRYSDSSDLKTILEIGQKIIENNGGAIAEENLINQLLKIIQNTYDQFHINGIKLALTLNENIEKNFNTITFKPYWKLIKVAHGQIVDIAEKANKILDKNHDIMAKNELIKRIKDKVEPNTASENLINSVLEIDKRIKFIDSNNLGLMKWRHINPKTLKDKIQFVLNKQNSPLHFINIANKITETQFDNKRINIQAVHNELIRNEEFVLIGRGIYALKDWGYSKGTVSDIIEKVLKNSRDKTLQQEKIIQEVLKERQVKKITVILNLKNKPQFQRIGRNTYQLAVKA